MLFANLPLHLFAICQSFPPPQIADKKNIFSETALFSDVLPKIIIYIINKHYVSKIYIIKKFFERKFNELNNENENENTDKISALNEFEIELQNNINNYETVTKNILKCIDSTQLKIFSSHSTK